MRRHVEKFRELAESERQVLTEVIPAVIDGQPNGELPWPLEGAEANLARFALLGGPDDAGEVAAPVAGTAAEALRRLTGRASANEPLDEEEVSFGLSMLAISLVLQAIGIGTRSDSAEGLLRRAAGADLSDEYRRRGGITALGFGLPDLADEIRDGVWLPAPLADFFETAAEWLRGNKSEGDLRASWSGLVSGACSVVDEYTFGCPALLACGRVVHVLLGGEAEDALAERVRAELLA